MHNIISGQTKPRRQNKKERKHEYKGKVEVRKQTLMKQNAIIIWAKFFDHDLNHQFITTLKR